MRFLTAILLLLFALPAQAQQGQGMSKALVVSSCGGQALSPGPLTNLMMNPQGQLCLTGIGGGTSSVWNATDAATNGMALTNGGLTVASPPINSGAVRGTISRTSGKYYIEFLNTVASAYNAYQVGLASSGIDITSNLGTTNYAGAMSFYNSTVTVSSGFVANGSGVTYAPAANDVFQVAADLTAGKVWFGLNNVWYASGNPATGANPLMSIVAPALGLALFPALLANGTFPTGPWTLQPTAASQKYAAPAGFAAWN